MPRWDDTPQWYWRQVYDLAFFVTIVIIWLNILFGAPLPPPSPPTLPPTPASLSPSDHPDPEVVNPAPI